MAEQNTTTSSATARAAGDAVKAKVDEEAVAKAKAEADTMDQKNESGETLQMKNVSKKTLYLTHGKIESGKTGKVTRAEASNLYQVLKKG